MSLLEDLLVEDLLSDPSRLDDNDDLEEVVEEKEAEEDANENEENKKKVTPKKRVKNPQIRLNPDLLRGPRGLSTVESYFKDIVLKGQGYEKEDLDRVMWRLQHWCHRLYPKFQFDDCLKKIEKLGSKRVVQTYVNKIRNGLLDHENQNSSAVNFEEMEVLPPEDIFDDLFDNQVQVTQTEQNKEVTDEMKERMLRNQELAKQKLLAKRLAEEQQVLDKNNDKSPEKENTQQLDVVSDNSVVTEEQKERMERQRQLAVQRRLERLRKQHEEKLQEELSNLMDTANDSTIDLDNSVLNI